MKRTDARHPNNDCKVWSQLERWQMEIIEWIKRETGMTESEIIRKLLRDKLREIDSQRQMIMSKVDGELTDMIKSVLR